MSDEVWMARALELARRGRGMVEPNPMVGAVIVRDGTVVGEGWHEQYGGPHAEVHALRQAGASARGATLYVTLEPCCHHGKTPPCTDAVLAAGITRVVAAMSDPFPLVAGQGAARLRQAGLVVEVGVAEETSRRMNAPYLKLVGRGRPWIHAKWAMTLDGKIATHTGNSQWISGEQSRRRVHALRGEVDGILVGSGTALADDPQLTARPPGKRTATRVVLDSRCRISDSAHLVTTARETPTLIVTTELSPGDKCARLAEQGCEVLVVPEVQGRASLAALLDELGRRRWTHVLVEGGAEVLGSLLELEEIDEVHLFLAAKLVGGRAAPGPVGGSGRATLDEAFRLGRHEIELLGDDVYWHGWREGS